MEYPPIGKRCGQPAWFSTECYLDNQVARMLALPILFDFICLLGIRQKEILPFEVSGDRDGNMPLLSHKGHDLPFPLIAYF